MVRKLLMVGAALAAWLTGCHAPPPEPEPPPLPPLPEFTNSLGMEFVLLPEGSFLMGHPSVPRAQPIHEVILSSFWIGRYEVTNAEWERFRNQTRPVESRRDRQPATRIEWVDAVAFCEWLSKQEDRKYRLPTEAEWEYAARGGLEQKYYPWGNQGARGRATYGRMETTEVGHWAPNRYGLYDMAGNLAEFVSDWFDPNYYMRSPKRDPQGPTEPGEGKGFRVRRDGFFKLYPDMMQCGWRDLCWPEPLPGGQRWDPDDPSGANGQGFRVALAASEGPQPAAPERAAHLAQRLH